MSARCASRCLIVEGGGGIVKHLLSGGFCRLARIRLLLFQISSELYPESSDPVSFLAYLIRTAIYDQSCLATLLEAILNKRGN